MKKIDEIRIKVLLLSDLFGSFVNEAGSWQECGEHYRLLRRAGVEILFFSGADTAISKSALSGLDEEAVLFARGGAALETPAGHLLGPGGDISARIAGNAPSQKRAAEWAIKRFIEEGYSVLTFGIGGGADDSFLESVDVGALLLGPNGEVCPLTPGPRVVHICSHSGQMGWNEWADNMLRRVEIVTNRE